MATEDVVKSVARELKYYFEVKRQEDGFDLSGIHQLALKKQPTHKYDGLHGRALKQHFSEPDAKYMITKLSNYDTKGALQGWREIEVRKLLDNYMKHYTFQKRGLPNCCQYHRKKVQTTGNFLHRRKKKQTNMLPDWPNTFPDQRITRGEAERLVNSATKIICGSELISLGKTSYSSGLRGKYLAGPLLQNDISRPTTAKSGSMLVDRNQQEKTIREFRSPRTQPRQKNKQTHSRFLSPAESTRSLSASSQNRSTYSNSSSSSVSSSRSSSRSRSHTPRQLPIKSQAPAVINLPAEKSQTEVGIERSTQTADYNIQLQEDEDKRPQSEYQVYVRTGDRLGAGTAATVKLTLFGDNGKTEEFDLNKMSKRHKIPFQKANEDKFVLSTGHVGPLRKIHIGHGREQINFAWYLENVTVYDMHTRRVYEFPCGCWLSGQDGDKKTFRTLLAESEREFNEALDARMTSAYRERRDAGPGMSSEPTQKSGVKGDNLLQSKQGDSSQASSANISSNVRVESSIVRIQQGPVTPRNKKDDCEQKATKIILRSASGSKIVDEIILENSNTDFKPDNDLIM